MIQKGSVVISNHPEWTDNPIGIVIRELNPSRGQDYNFEVAMNDVLDPNISRCTPGIPFWENELDEILFFPSALT